jgi:hypothetical protein
MAVGDGRRQSQETHLRGVGGDEAESRVRLDMPGLRAAEIRTLPDVVGHVDAVEPCGLGGLHDLGQPGSQLRGAGVPRGVRNVQPELHAALSDAAS